MLRRRSIRTRIVVLVLVPVIALIGLYVVALSLTLSSYLSLLQAANVRDAVTNPITNVQLQINAERGLALEYLADPSNARLLRLLGQETDTDAAIRAFTTAEAGARSDASPGERQASRRWANDLATLRALRATVVNVGLSRAAAASSYSALIAGADYVLAEAVLPVLNSSALIQANDLLSMEESLQSVAEERDLFTADLANHSYPAADAKLVDQLIGQHRELWTQGTSSLDTRYLKIFAADIPAVASTDLASFEGKIFVGPRGAMRVPLHAWTTSNDAYAAGFRKALRSVQGAIRQTGYTQAGGVLLRLLLIGGLGLCAIAGAIAVAIILSSALLQQLDDLRLSALELSSVRLPIVLARLRSGEGVDIASETPQLDPRPNEIGQLARAFNLAAQTAVSAAADEAEIRRGVNDVFRNLARRNQSLLTRQLELLDAMERRVDDPEELADLFRIDHLTTRMRRHAEGLLIVAGGSSGRVWRDPVPIVDVMRAAVAEIEDYTRIRVASRSSSSLAGHAVADVIHLLAELVENATTFSPANTPVRIESDNVAKGLIVEIEDRGLGMSDAQLQEINTKLSDPPLLDLSGSEQLGLFIAGQLARRHEVKITMRASAYGGVIVVVLIPSELVVDPGYDQPLTVIGIRELGGRPMPQLPAPATSAGEQTAVGERSAADADLVGTPGYLVDLETAATSITTTAVQVGAGPTRPVAEGKLADDLLSEIPPAELEPVQPEPSEPEPADLMSVDARTDLVPADADSADLVGSGAAAAELRGAGPWLIEATGARQPERESESGSAPLAGGAGSEPPRLILGATTEVGPVGPVGPVDPASSPSVQAGQAGHSVGWPDRSTMYTDWLSLADDAAKRSAVADDLPSRAAGRPDEPGAWLRDDTPPERRPDRPSNGSADEAYATGTVPLLPRRQGRTAGPSRDQSDQLSPWSDALAGRHARTPASPGPTDDLPAPELDGLPVRVRQANIAPQLRDQSATTQPHEYIAAPQLFEDRSEHRSEEEDRSADQVEPTIKPTEELSPEAARSLMSALQRGWERGRSVAEQLTDEPDGDQS